MTPERWQQVRNVFHKILPLDAAERASHLDKACASDAELRREVESLLQADGQAGSAFLNTPAVQLKPEPADAHHVPSRVGRRIGAYTILEEIGHGGMGEVYRAVRADGEFSQQVAIKLVRGGYNPSSILERFRNERQILAGLDHLNIARLLDGGTDGDGSPYLVMEFVDGETIDSYCDTHQLNVTRRLELFRQVCAAVRYAHQRLVIHRDLKPGNILVTKDGVPKLLDFGIAKILDPSLGAETTLARPMTPEYASPEQIRGESITTASDIYSLGVVLYQLLTGRSPYRVQTCTPHELSQAITQAEPDPPSIAVLRSARPAEGGELPPPTPEQVSAPREGSPAKLLRRLVGDIDNIVLKALRKEPQRRYASVDQFDEDIHRHLTGLPVSARKDSWNYRAGKFAQRHKAGVAAAALVLVMLIAGVVTILREARIASENQRKAEKRFNEVRKLADSLIFEIHDSIKGLPGATAARKLIVQRSREYLDSLAQEATGDVSLQRELASAYERLGTVQGDADGASLGDAQGGLQSLQKALAIRQGIARTNPENVEDLVALSRAYQESGRLQWYRLGGTREGLQSVQRAARSGEAAVRLESTNLHAIEVLAQAYQLLGDIQGGSGLRGGTSNLHDALQNHLKALPLLQKVVEATPADPEKAYLFSRATVSAGDDYLRSGDADQALRAYQRAEEILRPVAEKINNAVYRRGFAVCHTRMGDALLMLGRPLEALAHYRTEWQILQPLAAADPKDMVVQSTYATSEGDIGHAMVEAGQVEQGKGMLLRAMAKTTAYGRAVDDSYSRVFLASTAALVGEAFERAGDAATAQQYYGQALDLYRATASADPADTEDAVNVVIMRNHLGGAHLKLGKAEEALEDYRSALAGEESLAAASPDNVELLYAQADTYAGLGDVSAVLAQRSASAADRSSRWSQGEQWYRKSLSAWQRIPNPGPVSPNLFRVSDRHEIARRLSSCKLHVVQVED